MGKESVVGAVDYREITHPDIRRLLVFENVLGVNQGAAREILRIVEDKPGAVISFATGVTMEGVYDVLVGLSREREVGFSGILALQGDDYYPADPERDEFSFASYLRRRVFGPLGIPADHRFEINALAENPMAEVLRYEALLAQHPVDLTILGIGPGSHIYFNEQGIPFNQRMFVANFSEATLHRDRVERGQDTPDRAITQGIENILDSGQILLVAFGARKGEWLRQALYGPIDSACPASALRLVGDKVTMVIDEEAAVALQQGGE